MENSLKNSLKYYQIIDSHLHLGYLASLNMPSNSEDNVIELLKSFGIKKAICAHHASLATVEFGIIKLFESLDRYKGFLYGYLVFNPNFAEASLNVIKRYIYREDIVGVKIHPSWHFCYPTDPKYDEFWKLATAKNIVVLTHSWNPNVPNRAQKFSDPFLFEEVVKKYPDLKLILAHAGGRGKYLYKVIYLLEKYSNLYVDFAGDSFIPGLIEEYVNSVGSDRLLFGTDMPWADVRYHLINVLEADIGEKDRKNIFGINACRLFNIKAYKF